MSRTCRDCANSSPMADGNGFYCRAMGDVVPMVLGCGHHAPKAVEADGRFA